MTTLATDDALLTDQLPSRTQANAVFPLTKFHRAAVRAEHIERAPLLAQCAGPDIGGDRVAWVSVDADDTGPRLFAAILTSLRELLGPALDAALDATAAPDADMRQDVLIATLDTLAATAPVTLMLDDLHLALDDADTRGHLDWLLARLPDQHRVIIASRRELDLDAVRQAAIRGEALELRGRDLRFGEQETVHFLCDRLGLDLTAADAAALEQRTEGWPAALYLAALRLRLGDDVDAVTAAFSAGDRDPFTALTDEVLRATPEQERRFLLELSVLDRFNAELCARVLGEEAETRATFRQLTRTSLLLSPLDRSRTWFRCHHLLREVLQARLLDTDPQRARLLHVRAGAWFESEGGESELREAMQHYLAAGEWDLAAELLARHSVRFVQSGALGGRAREWLTQFPTEVITADARLCYVSAVLAALDGDRAGRDAWLSAAAHGGWEGPMPDGTASLALAASCLTAMICFDDAGGALAASSTALAALPPASPMRAAVQALSAWHAHLLGDRQLAERLASDAIAGQPLLPAATLPLVAYLPSAVLALCAGERGDLALAERLSSEAVRARDAGPLRGAPHSLPVTCALARVLTLRGEPDAAVARCMAGLELAREWRDSSLMVPAALLELARAQLARGDHEAAARVARAGSARIAGARDPGTLAVELAGLEGRGGTAPAPGRLAPDLRDIDGVEPLSPREIEVLRALALGGSLREVADQLYISRNTIKTHTRALYAKLGVGTREEAVRRGGELHLLSRGRELR